MVIALFRFALFRSSMKGTGVDPMAGEEIAAELVELNRQSRVTMLVANHGAFPYDKADRTLFIKD